MIDITKKKNVYRMALASGIIHLGTESIAKIRNTRKGDAIYASEIAGNLAVKNCAGLIPHCHPIQIENISFSFDVLEKEVKVTCEVESHGKTGVEMEALCGATTALLTLWDMLKMYEKDENGQYPSTLIENIRVEKKVKGNEL